MNKPTARKFIDGKEVKPKSARTQGPRKRLAHQSDRDYAGRLAKAFMDLPPERGGREDGMFLARQLYYFSVNGKFVGDPVGTAAWLRSEMGRIYWLLRRDGLSDESAVQKCAEIADCDLRTARAATRKKAELFTLPGGLKLRNK